MLDDLNSTEFAPSEPKSKAEIISMKLVRFFNPVTCRPKTNQPVQPCKAGGYINKTLCLQHECCTPSKSNIKFPCYIPFEDRPQKILRFFGIGIGGVMLVACFPFCFYIVEKSPCANSLRRTDSKEGSKEGSEESGSDGKESNDSQSESLLKEGRGN
nr:FMR1 neighbor protein [Anolis sagrei ordinatus]